MMRRSLSLAFLALAAVLASLIVPSGRGLGAIPKKDAWYTQHYFIMQDFERKAYRRLSVEGRKKFQELFWTVRTGEARAQFQSRLQYVIKTYWHENSQQPWNNDRARVYLLNGTPASIEYDQNVDWALIRLPGQAAPTSRSGEDVAANRAEIWIYPYGRYFIKYVFVYSQANQWKLAPSTDARYLGELEENNKTVLFGIADVERYKAALAALGKAK